MSESPGNSGDKGKKTNRYILRTSKHHVKKLHHHHRIPEKSWKKGQPPPIKH